MEKQKGEHVLGKSGSQKPGASNLEYDLFSEVHCLLKGNAALEQYMEDARQAGDREAETTFKAIHDQNKESVGKLRDLIGKHIKAA
ncbi:Hypothetical protein A7982_08559 [Minicystis rosea]|nr:Hypothetical protein A7982_08559 [Minicystis rosea]